MNIWIKNNTSSLTSFFTRMLHIQYGNNYLNTQPKILVPGLDKEDVD